MLAVGRYLCAGGLGALLGAGLVLFWPRDDAFEQAAQHAEAVSDSAGAAVTTLIAVADSAEQRAVEHAAISDTREQATEAEVRDILSEPAVDPQERGRWIAVVDSLRASNASLRAAFAEQQRALASLRLAVDTLQAARHAADSALALRPGIRVPRWGISVRPGVSVGPGVFAGINTRGEPVAGAGAAANIGISIQFGRQ